jgi:hypothetical protein
MVMMIAGRTSDSSTVMMITIYIRYMITRIYVSVTSKLWVF